MAIQEHVEVVKQGAAAIVQWRARNPDTRLDLHGANLRKVDLSGAGAIWSCGPGGSRYDMCYFVQHDHGLMVNCGCFWGTLAEFEAAVEEGHGDNEYGRYYRAVIEAAKAWQS